MNKFAKTIVALEILALGQHRDSHERRVLNDAVAVLKEQKELAAAFQQFIANYKANKLSESDFARAAKALQ